MTIFTSTCFGNISDERFFIFTRNWSIFILKKKITIQFKKRGKMIGHRIRVREKEDLPRCELLP